MSDTLDKIEKYKRSLLLELYNQCTEEQQKLFCRMYVSVEKIPEDKINCAIQQCERTIEKNKNKLDIKQ